MDLKELHDKWLSAKPEGAAHDEVGCPHCNPDITENSTGGGDMKTYTEDEFNTAAKEAVAPLQAEVEAKDKTIAELEAKLQSAADAADEVEVQGEVAKVQAELDKAEVRVAEAEKRYNDVVSYLQAEADAIAEAAAQEARRNARRTAIKDSTSLSDEKIEERLEIWVALDDEAFESHLEVLKDLSSATPAGSEASAARETAMSNVRESSDDGKTAGATVFGARSAGVDVRKI